MAKLNAPLMSFDARGKLAGSLVFMGWKGLKTVRQFVVPANPKSADQVVQRNFFTTAVSFWRNFLTNAASRTGWDRSASLAAKPQSGFNAFVGNALKAQPGLAASSFASETISQPGVDVDWTLLDVSDGASGTEAGPYDVFAGLQPESLDLIGSPTASGGTLNQSFAAFFSVGDTVYTQIRRLGTDRSGIDRLIMIT